MVKSGIFSFHHNSVQIHVLFDCNGWDDFIVVTSIDGWLCAFEPEKLILLLVPVIEGSQKLFGCLKLSQSQLDHIVLNCWGSDWDVHELGLCLVRLIPVLFVNHLLVVVEGNGFTFENLSNCWSIGNAITCLTSFYWDKQLLALHLLAVTWDLKVFNALQAVCKFFEWCLRVWVHGLVEYWRGSFLSNWFRSFCISIRYLYIRDLNIRDLYVRDLNIGYICSSLSINFGNDFSWLDGSAKLFRCALSWSNILKVDSGSFFSIRWIEVPRALSGDDWSKLRANNCGWVIQRPSDWSIFAYTVWTACWSIGWVSDYFHHLEEPLHYHSGSNGLRSVSLWSLLRIRFRRKQWPISCSD